LTLRQGFHGILDRGHHLRLLELVRGRGRNIRVLVHLEGFQRIGVVHVERTFVRRKWSRIVFCKMRWKRSGSSGAGRVEYFSASFIIESCTMSSAACSSCTAYTVCLKARRSTEARKSDSSFWVARFFSGNGWGARACGEW
jgi:hypothetical protein